ncbi:UBC-like protein [Polychaeton citri CBS 116435]|uniref:E2 ubiquitin-conjugating enzyme n=1 Tax=Polychaeton citri CBS 116435 TaxID=1314669 RepID=A0A9P4UIN4_9PEZI|nr:UBC-like protein [Polychaeton citri CBS 116435]
MTTNKRIMKELADIQGNPPPGTQVTLANEEDMNVWEVILDGPSGTPYQGGRFLIQITLPREYPFKPPVLSFKTKIYHPNVSNDDRGAMCLGMLRADEWKPPNKIHEVLRLVSITLETPQPDDAVEPSIADQFRNNKAEFDKTASDWTKKYAAGR